MKQPTAKITKYTADKWRAAYKGNPRQRIRMVKTFELDDNGKLKKGRPGTINTGRYDSTEVDLQGLKDLILSLGEQEALGLGVAEKPAGKIGYKAGQLRRTKENFFHQDGPAFLLLDVDGVDIQQQALLNILEGIIPGFDKAGKLLVPSSSSGLYGPNSELLKDATSVHIYLIIKDGLDAQRFMDCLFDRLWLAGHGFYLLSKTPSLLKRAIIDPAVSGSERIIYEGSPICKEGVVQKRDEPILIKGEILDTMLLSVLSPEEKVKLNDIYQVEKEKINPALKKASKEKVGQIEKEFKCSRKKALSIFSDRKKGILDDDFILHYSKGEIKVSEILDNGDKYDKERFADPNEPDYDGGSLTKAIFYWNDGERPMIRSHAHGGIVYSFVRFRKNKKDKENVGNSDLLSQMLKRFIYIRDGNRVADLEKPPQYAIMKKDEFMTGYKALGKVFFDKEPIQGTIAFFSSPERRLVIGERYNPSKKTIYKEDGVEWFNSFYMPKWEETTDFSKVSIIIEHIDYLFPGPQAERFLNWMAWTVHEPQTRIKFTPLLISKHHGTGRGWLMELIERLVGRWNCSTTDMPTLVGEGSDGKFQDYMKDVIFTYIGEVKVAGKKAYAVDDSIRAKLTDSPLPMNLKYGNNGTYPVFTNFCFMSNNFNAMLPPKEDRRIDVFEHFNEPREEDYYISLYNALNDDEVLRQFFWCLRELYDGNQDSFNPLGRAVMSPAKRRLINSSSSEIGEAIDFYIKNEKRDVIAFRDIKDGVRNYFVEMCGIEENEARDRVDAATSQLIAISGKKCTPCNEGKKVKINGLPIRLMCIRNTANWLECSTAALRAEYSVTAF